MKKLLTTAAIASALLLSPFAFAQQYYLVVPLHGGYGSGGADDEKEDLKNEWEIFHTLSSLAWNDDLTVATTKSDILTGGNWHTLATRFPAPAECIQNWNNVCPELKYESLTQSQHCVIDTSWSFDLRYIDFCEIKVSYPGWQDKIFTISRE